MYCFFTTMFRCISQELHKLLFANICSLPVQIQTPVIGTYLETYNSICVNSNFLVMKNSRLPQRRGLKITEQCVVCCCNIPRKNVTLIDCNLTNSDPLISSSLKRTYHSENNISEDYFSLSFFVKRGGAGGGVMCGGGLFNKKYIYMLGP